MKNDQNTNNNSTETTTRIAAPVQSQSANLGRKYNLFLGNECYGFVHAHSEQEALYRVAAFGKPFTAQLAENQ